MPSMEEIELEKLRKALDKDVLSLVDKYLQGDGMGHPGGR